MNENQLLQFYFYGLSYKELLEVKQYFNDKYERKSNFVSYANIVTNALSIIGTQEQIEDVVQYAANKGFSFKISMKYSSVTKL